MLSDSVGYPHNSPQGTSGAGENLTKVRVTDRVLGVDVTGPQMLEYLFWDTRLG